jgi:hypothetical protein
MSGDNGNDAFDAEAAELFARLPHTSQSVMQIAELRILGEKVRSHALLANQTTRNIERRLDDATLVREALTRTLVGLITRAEYQTAHESHGGLIDQARINLSRYVTKLEELDRATVADRAQLDRRLEMMNEVRAQLKDQAGTFITRNEAETVFRALSADVRRLDTLTAALPGKTEHENLDTRLQRAENKLATWDGRMWAVSAVFLLLNAAVSWLLSGAGHAH